ncbi:MAG: cell wall hydrolase [Thermohalobaculum sp.]|nr:cell wall hydrolase [Thermohalobaculum sp.]
MRAGRTVAALVGVLLAACTAAEAPVGPGVVAEAVPGAQVAVAAGPATRAARTRSGEMPPPDAAGPMDDPLTCLARTVYWESKGQPVEGQAAVAHVVLNRARAPGYPAEVCEVVMQGGQSRSCQFHFHCDGRDDAAREPDAYATAHRVAWEALTGTSADPSRGATMFHNRSVRPSWANSARRTAQIGDHSFYR